LLATDCDNDPEPASEYCAWIRDGEYVLRPGNTYTLRWANTMDTSRNVEIEIWEQDTLRPDQKCITLQECTSVSGTSCTFTMPKIEDLHASCRSEIISK
jgi:hypothetical protein